MTQDNQTDTDKNKPEDKSPAPAANQSGQQAKGNDKPSASGDKKPGFSSK